MFSRVCSFRSSSSVAPRYTAVAFVMPLLCGLLAPLTVSAEILVEAGGSAHGEPSSASFSGADTGYAIGRSSLLKESDDATLFSSSGPDIFCPDFNCVFGVGDDTGYGAALGDGPQGKLRVHARATGGSYTQGLTSGFASAILRDTLTFNTSDALFHVLFDINELSAGADYGSAGISFSIVLRDFFPGNGQDDPAQDQVLFSIGVEKSSYFDVEPAAYSVMRAEFNPLDPFAPNTIEEASGTSIPGHFDLDVDLSGWFAPGVATEVDFVLSAFTDCDDEVCFARARSDNTAHIGVVSPFVSLAGYAYPVVQAPVPLPAGALLLGTPLLLMATRRRTRN